MALDVTDREAQAKKDAYELASTLRSATCTKEVHVVQIFAGGGAEILLELNQRTIPEPMLETISEYGELHIEGVRGPTLECTVLF